MTVINFDLYRIRRNTVEARLAIENESYAEAIKLLDTNLKIFDRIKRD